MKIANSLLRRSVPVVVAVVLGWAALALFNLYRVHYPNREHAMIPVLQDMQTFCVGRYLIDLPRGSVLYRALASAGGAAAADFSAEQPVPRYQFESIVLKRWVEIQKMKLDQLGQPFTQAAERTEILPDALILTYNNITRTGRWPGGKVGTKSFYDTDGYLWRNDTLFTFTESATKEEVIAAVRRLQPRSNTDIPAAQGFCAAHSFFPGPPEDGESTNFALHLPTNPPVELRIGTMDGDYKKVDPGLFNLADFKMSVLRDAQHVLADLSGEEWIHGSVGVKGEGYRSTLNAYWQHPAGESFSRQPSVNINMTLSVEEKTPPPTSGQFPPKKAEGDIGKEEFLALWDGILKTLRPRPGAF